MRRLLWLALFPSLGCSSPMEHDDVGFGPDGSVDAVGADCGGAAGATTGGTAGAGGVDAASDETAPIVCDGVSCSGVGTCEVVDGGQPSCVCEAGYHAEGLACVTDETCAGVDCGRCGKCEVIGGKATCTCPDGLSYDGNGCVVDPNPCDTIDCGSDAVCVPESHCHPLGACVPTCDCSNCGNCTSDNSDGRWNDWQEYCGAQPDQSPATVTCNKPCPPGDGCLPYSQPFCWPMQGCFSM
jgi:hypothetical protein